MRPPEDIYELSPMQSGLLFDQLGSSDPGAHVVQLVYELGPVDEEAFREAWRATIARHAILRTSFHHADLERPLQVVQAEVEVPLARADGRHRTAEERASRLDAFLHEDRRRGFALDAAPLFRLQLIDVAPGETRFLWSFHHILFEGWSASLVLRDMLAFYEARVTGEVLHLPEPPPYRDYVRWLQEQPTGEGERAWREELAGFHTPTPLPGLGHRTASRRWIERYDARERRLSKEETAELTRVARANDLTPSTIVHGAWALLLSRAAGEEDVLFGTLVSGRSAPLPGIERTCGLFTNLQPCRVAVDGERRVVDWLRELQTDQARMRAWEHLPLAQVKTWSDVPTDLPLFETLVIFENWFGDVTLADHEGALEVRGVQGHHGGPGFPLSLVAWPSDELTLSLSYDRDLYGGELAERLLAHLASLLRGLTARPEGRLADVALLGPGEGRALVDAWNPDRDPTPLTCVHRRFEAQVARRPEAVALEFRGEALTYRELNRRANRLAHTLRTLGVGEADGPESRVGIYLERSLEMVVAIWAVLKAGGAYVPLDPELPRQRMAFVLQDAGLTILLTQETLLARLPGSVEHVLRLDADWPRIAAASADDPDVGVGLEDLAFVTYTSGSTGHPKGSMVTHRGLANALLGWERVYELEHVRSHLALASLAVDVLSADVVRSHCTGARLVLAPHEDLFSPARLADLLRRERIGYAEFVPHVLGQVVAHLESTGQRLDDLDLFVVGSDVWLGREWARARAVCGPRTRLVNAYGLNETSVDCTWFEDGDAPVAPGSFVPIGKPFPNHRVYVLDAQRRPVPDGFVGELWIGGAGVVRGYLNQPAITAERFLPDPFVPDPGARMLRTGDRVRRLPGGSLEILGRVDQQVKVRAFRVELGEIECALQDHPSVEQAVAIVWDDERGERRLVAYLVADASLGAAAMRRFLADRLPSYMVPSAFVFLEELPLTSNRLKVDRSALPPPGDDALPREGSFVAPRTELERRLADIWLDVLPVERVGVHDNFLNNGGHSLLLIPVLARIESELGLRLHPGELAMATLAQLAATVEQRLSASRSSSPGTEPTARRRGLLRRVFGG